MTGTGSVMGQAEGDAVSLVSLGILVQQNRNENPSRPVLQRLTGNALPGRRSRNPHDVPDTAAELETWVDKTDSMPLLGRMILAKGDK